MGGMLLERRVLSAKPETDLNAAIFMDGGTQPKGARIVAVPEQL